MHCLDRVAAIIDQTWTHDRQKDRDRVVGRIKELLAACEEAMRVWQGYLDAPGAPGDKNTIVSWVGGDRAKRLHEMNLAARALVNEVCASAGGEAARFLAFEDDLVEMAYRGLKEGETGPDAARAAIGRMQATTARLRELLKRIGAAKLPAARKAAAKPAKTAAGKKRTTGKKKVAKAATTKKRAVKPAKKKAAKAAATKKKTASKKPAPAKKKAKKKGGKKAR